jgi:hypothetical protein
LTPGEVGDGQGPGHAPRASSQADCSRVTRPRSVLHSTNTTRGGRTRTRSRNPGALRRLSRPPEHARQLDNVGLPVLLVDRPEAGHGDGPDTRHGRGAISAAISVDIADVDRAGTRRTLAFRQSTTITTAARSPPGSAGTCTPGPALHSRGRPGRSSSGLVAVRRPGPDGGETLPTRPGDPQPSSATTR